MTSLSFVFAVVIVFALLGALKGLIRGFHRQGVRFLSVIIAAVAAFIVTSQMADNVYTALKCLNEESVTAMGESAGFEAEGVEFLRYLDLNVLSDVLAVPFGLIVIPFLFVIMFFLFRLLMLVIFWIACGILRLGKKEKTGGVRFGGFLIGAVQGFAVALLVLIPVFGLANTVVGFTDSLEGTVDEETLDTVTAEIQEVADSPLNKITMTCGGKLIYASLSKIPEAGSEFVNRTDDPADRLESVTDIVCAVVPVMDVDFSAMTDADKEAVTAMINTLTDDAFLCNFTVGMLRYASVAIKSEQASGETESDETLLPLIATLSDVFADETETNLKADLNTVRDVLFLFSDNNVISALADDFDAFSKALGQKMKDSEETVLSATIDILNANPHTASIVNALAKISVSMMSESAGVSEEVYDNLKGGMNDVLAVRPDNYATHEEYTEALSGELGSALTENGINLDAATVDAMAEYIAENYSDVTEVDDSQFCDILLSYFAAYAEQQEAE